MSAIAGVLNVTDTEAAFLANVGQELVFDAINLVLGYHNADVLKATSVFVKGNTEKFTQRWLAPGSGEMSPAGQDPQAPGPSIQRWGSWDVSYPLREYSEAVSGSRVGLAYMTVAELDAHLDTIMERDLAQHRLRMLIALMEDTNLAWTDIKHGALTIRRLANTDGALFPPLPGATAEAQDHHYIDAGYAVAAIAAANNPVVTLRDEILEHFGGRSSLGDDIVYFCGSDQTAYLEVIAGFVPVGDMYVRWGDDTDLAKQLPNVPGRIIGRGWGSWISEWAWMPATYGMSVHLNYPPLMRRVDTGASGLPAGLSLVATDRDHPLEAAYYSDRFGYGVGNRLSAACIYIAGANGGYSPPSAYAE